MEYHPKFVERWGKIYVARYLKNSEQAIKWALEFFPDDLVPLIVEQSKKELAKKGMKPKQ